MWHKINSLSPVKIAFFVLITNVLFYYFASTNYYQFATNFRVEFFLRENTPAGKFAEKINYEGFLIKLNHCIQDEKCKLHDLKSDDDIGSILVFWLGNKLTPVVDLNNLGPKTFLMFRTGADYPLASKVFYISIHLLSFCLFCFFATQVFPATLVLFMGLALSIFENFFYISYSMDVYFFPIYVIMLSLVVLDLSKKSLMNLVIVGFFIGLFCLMRSSGSLIFYSAISSAGLFYLFKKKYQHIKMLAVLLISFLIVYKSPLLIFDSATHATWHSLHTGLYERGGSINEEGFPIPKHLLSSEKQKQLHFTRWDDALVYNIILNKNFKGFLYDKEYDELVKKSYLELLKMNPLASVFFYLKRLPILLSFNPYKYHPNMPFTISAKSYEVLYSPKFVEEYSTSVILSLIFLGFWMTFLYLKNISLLVKFFFFSTLLASLVPGFLVHPSHTIYNAPILFTQWFIIAITFHALFKLPKTKLLIDKIKKLSQA